MWIYIVVGSPIAFVVATGYIIIVFFMQKFFGIVLFLGEVWQNFGINFQRNFSEVGLVSGTVLLGNLMYSMLWTRSDIYYIMRVVVQYQSDLREKHWIAVKYILKYLKRTRDYMLVYSNGSLETIDYIDSNF